MKIKNFDIKACVFDLDGTLLDSCLVWSDVDDNFFHKRGMEVPKDYGKSISTMGLGEAAIYTKKRFNLQENEEDIVFEWISAVKNEYENKVLLKKGAKDFLDYLKKNNVPLIVATANSEECYLPCLKRLGILDEFDSVFDVRGIKGGKTSPEIYLKACDKLNLEPSEIMVFEDTLVALETAESAGFKTCAVYEETCVDESIKEMIGDIYIYDFHELMD